MPFEWLDDKDGVPVKSGASFHSRNEPPLAVLHAWPYRSLPKRGFVLFIGLTCALLGLPLMALIGTKALWGLLPFLAAAVALTWWLLQRSYSDGEILEELMLWSDHVSLSHQRKHKEPLVWTSNPYWTELTLHKTGRPVEAYLTLSGGGGRTVELGAFLSADERRDLHDELSDKLRACRQTTKPPL